MRTSALSLTLALALALPIGCAEKTPSPPPLGKAPAEAVKDPVKSTMWALATEVTTLRELAERSGPLSADDKAEMKRRLERIDALLHGIDPTTGGSAHPLLTSELPAFRNDVKLAVEALAAEPPDLEKVKLVTDGCRRCHVVASAPSPRAGALALDGAR